MPLDLTDDKSTLVQVMACCRQATSHYLSQCWPRFMSPYGVTRPQRVKKTSQLHITGPLSSKASWMVVLCHRGPVIQKRIYSQFFIYGPNNRSSISPPQVSPEGVTSTLGAAKTAITLMMSTKRQQSVRTKQAQLRLTTVQSLLLWLHQVISQNRFVSIQRRSICQEWSTQRVLGGFYQSSRHGPWSRWENTRPTHRKQVSATRISFVSLKTGHHSFGAAHVLSDTLT